MRLLDALNLSKIAYSIKDDGVYFVTNMQAYVLKEGRSYRVEDLSRIIGIDSWVPMGRDKEENPNEKL